MKHLFSRRFLLTRHHDQQSPLLVILAVIFDPGHPQSPCWDERKRTGPVRGDSSKYQASVQTSSALTLLLTVQITLHRQKTLHFTDLGRVFHSLHQLLHLLASALIVVSCLQTETRAHFRI